MTRILTIGFEEVPKSVDKSIDWTVEYNIKDFDAVFANLQKIVDQRSSYTPPGNRQRSVILPPTDHLENLLDSGGDIYVFLPESQSIYLKHHKSGSISGDTVDLFGWLPDFEYYEESGSTIDADSVDRNWTWYFDSNFGWPGHFGGIGKGARTDGDYFPLSLNKLPLAFGKSLARNRVGESIALETKLSYSPIGDSSPDFPPGSIYLLPSKSNVPDGEIVNQVIDRFNKGDDQNSVGEIPDWIEHYTLPEERELLERIHKQKQLLDELESRLNGEERYKELLYERGPPLEEAVHKSLSQLGLVAEGETPHSSDGVIELEGVRIMVEIYGTKKGISIDKASQLDDWVDEELLSNPEKAITGILIANPYCEDDPLEREIDPNNVIKYLDARGYKLMTTIDLFKALRAYQAGSLTTEDFSKQLLGDSTVIEFPDIPLREE